MSLSKGAVVLVPFPFTDLSQTKLRPAVVLWVNPYGRDVTLCFMSSQNLEQLTSDEFIIEQNSSGFEQTGLKMTSKVKAARIVTIDVSMLLRQLGNLSVSHMKQLDQALMNAFQIER